MAFLLTSCSSSPDPAPRVAAAPSPTVASPSPAPASSPSPSPLPSPEDVIRDASGDTGAVSDDDLLRAWLKPDDDRRPRHVVVTANPIDQRLVFLIRKIARTTEGEKWFEVWLPERPNGLTGWVRAKDVDVVHLEQSIEVDLSDRTLRHYVGDELAHEFLVGIGTETNPTPTGTYFLWSWDQIEPPTGVYGAYAFGISGFAPNLSDWEGGGRVAIHGTTNSGDRGQAVSHGCIRVFNDDIVQLAGLEVGTPVRIHP
ncbi:MAG: L,D-transpeptidase [Actinomycetota bacterium]